jgi:nucleotide-binding universal stress UspA family protein
MTSIKQGSVVVGVDGSTTGDAALGWAAHYAAARHRPLLLVHGAGEDRTGSDLFGHPGSPQAAARQVIDRALDRVKDLGLLVDVEVSAPARDPREALLDCAAKASMLVVGTRGLGPVGMLLLGAVSAAVAAHASCPVAVVRPDQAEDVGVRHVVVGTDGGPASTAALELAFDLASTEGRPLDVVHSWAGHDVFVDLESDGQRLEHMEEHKRMLAEALAGCAEKYPDVVVERHLPETSATETLLSLSGTASAVVVGSRGRTGPRALLSSVSRDLVERAACTVIVVRP